MDLDSGGTHTTQHNTMASCLFGGGGCFSSWHWSGRQQSEEAADANGIPSKAAAATCKIRRRQFGGGQFQAEQANSFDAGQGGSGAGVGCTLEWRRQQRRQRRPLQSSGGCRCNVARMTTTKARKEKMKHFTGVVRVKVNRM